MKKKSSAAMKARIRSNYTVLIVSFLSETIQSFCDRVIWTDGGVRKMEGVPEEVSPCYQRFMENKPT